MRALFAACAAATVAAAFPTAPVYEQCDPRWGKNEMGVNGNGERSTICGEGCAMSSLSSALAAFGATINGKAVTPGTFNAWLEANNGYTCAAGDCNNLILTAVTGLWPQFTLIGEVPTPPLAQLQAGLDGGDIVYLAHVRNRTHFVLLTGYEAGTEGLTVMDPNNHANVYPYGNVSDVIMYYVGHGKQASLPAAHAGYAGQAPLPPAPFTDFPSTAVIPRAYPLYKQCDPRWGNNLIINETLCAVGCLESSTSMAIAGNNILVGGKTADPGTVNIWLKSHGGYDAGNDLDEDVVPTINPAHIAWNDATDKHMKNDIPMANIRKMLTAGAPVIAWVLDGRHFVLVVGWDSQENSVLYVNDPGFNRLSYDYNKDVVGWRLFQMQDCTSGPGCATAE